MLIWNIITTTSTIILLIIFLSYRRQVKKTCRYLAFMKKNKTNLRLTQELPFSELNALADEVNELLDQTKEIQIQSEQNENNLKEAITNISHDIRTPLTSLDGFFQLLKTTKAEEERLQYVDIIQNRIYSLKNMLEELFTYTKLQNNEYKIELTKIDFNRCICTTMLSFYNEFQKRELEVRAGITEEDIYINGNLEALQRIIENILKNVLEHAKEEVHITLKKDDMTTTFTCKNKVNNIEEIDIDKIFSRFYKADQARTHSSTGLGLAIAKELTDRMKGYMKARIDKDYFIIEVRFNTIPKSV